MYPQLNDKAHLFHGPLKRQTFDVFIHALGMFHSLLDAFNLIVPFP